MHNRALSENTKRQPVQPLTDEQLEQAAGGRLQGTVTLYDYLCLNSNCKKSQKGLPNKPARCKGCGNTNIDIFEYIVDFK